MRAITFEQFGGPEVLHLSEVPEPQAGPGQVRIRVRAVGVNPIEGKIRSGTMEAAFPTPLPAIPGSEVAGVVDQLGEGVTDLVVGDEVLGWADSGAYAEYATGTQLAKKPAGLDWAIAAAIPAGGETARRALGLLGVGPGETLIVHGAAGNVGTFAVQLATDAGAIVIGTASEANQDYVRALGAVPVVYGDGLVERVRALAPGGVDAALDVAGKGALEDSIELTGGTERVVTIADMNAAALGVRFARGTAKDRSIPALTDLAVEVAEGDIHVTVSHTFPLADAAEAARVSDAGHVRGKLVLLVD